MVCKFWNIERNLCIKTLRLVDKDKEFFVRDFKLTHNRTLLTLCDDSLLRVFDLTTGVCLKAAGHASTLHYEDEMHLVTDELAAVTKKEQILFYNYETCEFVKSFNLKEEKENDKVKQVKLLKVLERKDMLFVFSCETTIKLLSFKSGDILQTYTGHKESVVCVQTLLNETCFASSTLNKIKVWHLESGECLRTITEDVGIICDLQLTDQGYLVSCSSAGSKIRIWDTWANFECIHKFETKVAMKRIKVLTNDRLVSFCTSQDFERQKLTVKVWDLGDWKCLNTFKIEDDDYLPNKFEFCSFSLN